MTVALAHAPGAHCTSGFKHEGTPLGSKVTLGGLKSYITKPLSGNNDKVALLFTDIFGPFYVNNQLLMDYFASNGYLVLAPDFFGEDPFHVAREREGFDFEAWVYPKFENAQKVASGWVEDAMSLVNVLWGSKTAKFVTVGYCFGATFALNILATDKVSAGAIVHPAFLNNEQFRNVTKPILLSCSEVDQTFPAKSRHISEDILAEIKATYHFQLFGGVAHGFAVRGDLDNENDRWAKEESANGVLRWWDRFIV